MNRLLAAPVPPRPRWPAPVRNCVLFAHARPELVLAEDVGHRVELRWVAVAQANDVEQELLVPRVAYRLVIPQPVPLQRDGTEGAAAQADRPQPNAHSQRPRVKTPMLASVLQQSVSAAIRLAQARPGAEPGGQRPISA